MVGANNQRAPLPQTLVSKRSTFCDIGAGPMSEKVLGITSLWFACDNDKHCLTHLRSNLACDVFESVEVARDSVSAVS